MEAIVLAGGLGTRLKTVLPDLPKALAPVGRQPFLAWLLQDLQAGGVTSVALAVGYRSEQVRALFGDTYHGLPLTYSVEDRPLGTGGAIRKALGLCTGQHVLVTNGDTVCEMDHRAMYQAHVNGGRQLTMAVVQMQDASRYGAVVLDGDTVAGFVEKGRAGSGLINGGVYLIERDLLDQTGTPEAFSFEHDVLVPRVAELRPLAYLCQGRFIDIGVPEDFARAQVLFGDRH